MTTIDRIAGLVPAALAFAVLCVAPVAAQESSYTPDVYWEVAMIDVEDGQGENYADYLAREWKATQEFAKSKGYIQDYHVLANNNNREDEPDLYLITVFKKIYDTPEQLRQQKEFEAHMKKDARVLDSEFGARGKMRRVTGSMLLRELKLK
ncbi:hypothetical protein [Sphingomonas cavernae]|uniref:DUF1330 domain-containing protein n=1 Tax=Sphingomonas cavernae TaxID=2320861 RepID=A0A418WRY0_9SPHN|nr:hypothetical protein [Sphingomonas cavernae]RJF93967.1 hypothetical protein D3876_06765 [Sphingomonas cavernae]